MLPASMPQRGWSLSSGAATHSLTSLTHPALRDSLDTYTAYTYNAVSGRHLSSGTPLSLVSSLVATRGLVMEQEGVVEGVNELVHQSETSWALQRISSGIGTPVGPTRFASAPAFTYRYDDRYIGGGVTVAVLDTGVDCNHPGIARAVCDPRLDFVTPSPPDVKGKSPLHRTRPRHHPYTGTSTPNQPDFASTSTQPYSPHHSTFDTHGHGTKVAGLINSYLWGVSKGCRVLSVRVWRPGGVGFTNSVGRAVDALLDRWSSGEEDDLLVMNISLSITGDGALRALFEEALRRGIPIVTSAGDVARDACHFEDLPNSIPSVITVAASDITDTATHTTNFGRCIAFFAPAQQVLTLSIHQHDKVTFLHPVRTMEGVVGGSGTSLGSGLVSGVVANWMSHPVVREKVSKGVWGPGRMRSWLVRCGSRATVRLSETVRVAGTTDVLVSGVVATPEKVGGRPKYPETMGRNWQANTHARASEIVAEVPQRPPSPQRSEGVHERVSRHQRWARAREGMRTPRYKPSVTPQVE
ncbi:hypothetical protein PYCC9005_004768 [Savitreella phatthalungensis]